MPVPTKRSRRAPVFAAGAFFFAAMFATAPSLAVEPAVALEEGLPLVERILPEDYRGLGFVNFVTVLPDGVVAFGSTAAVYFYDRAGFTRVPVPTTYVNGLLRDSRGRLWVAGDAALGIIEPDPATGVATFVSQLGRLPAGTPAIGIMRTIVQGTDGTIFAASERGVVRISPDGGTQWWALPADNYPRLIFANGRLLHASTASGVSLLEGDTFRNISAPGTLAARIYDLFPGPSGHVRVLTLGGVFDCDLATTRLTPFSTPLDSFLRAHPANSALTLADGRCAMNLVEGGLLLTEPDWTRARIFTKAHGLSSNRIGSLASDGEDGLWLATSNGLTRLQLGHGVTVFDERSGFTANGIWDLVRHEGVFFASGVEGLLRLAPADPASGSPAHFEPEQRFRGAAISLLSHDAGLVLGTNKGVALLGREGPPRAIFEINDAVRYLMASRRDPTVVFACSERGLHILRHTPDGLARVATLLRDLVFWNVAEESDGTLWGGTRSSGIVRITPPADGDWNHAGITQFPLGTAGLPATAGWTGAYAAFGEIQLLADDGTHRWDSATNTLPLDDRIALDGRHDVRTLPVVTDSRGRAWTSPWHGVAACSRPLGWFDSGRAWHDAPPVAAAAVGFFGAGRMMVEGREPEILWAKGNTALVRLDLAVLHAMPAPAGWHPALRQVRAAGRSWPLAVAAAPAFPFAREPIMFRFSAPRHAPGSGVRYRTRLLGFDAAWSAPETAIEREFTNLSGGPFTFEVQAVDTAGHESPIARYPFSVTPPWHRRPLAFALYALGTLGAIVVFVRWRLGHGERERVRLEQLVATRTAELAAARDQAESASRAKSAFLASMSHELRTPLNGVIGYAQVLQGDQRLLPDQQERLRIVRSSGEHLLHMINDVLDLAKIEAGKLELRVAPFALGELLREIAAAHADSAAAKRLVFTLEAAPDLPAWVEGDAQKLRQVLDNLVGNAIKFTAKGGVTLRVAMPPAVSAGGISFAVADTGPGIAANEQGKLFRPFEQAHATRANLPGTGLGLAISRALVERMSGELGFESAVGIGSTFAFSLVLPAVAPAVAPAAPVLHVVGFDGPSRRVLIVDDHPVNRSLLSDLLLPLGFGCTAHESGTVALAALTSGRDPWPDLAILDVRMEEMDGLELTRQLRAIAAGRALRVLLTSASVLTFNPADGLAAGCDDFLPKPFRTADLVEKIGTLLALRWRAAESRSPFTAADAGQTIPAAARDSLRELLAQGDLAAFRAALDRLRREDPTAETHWRHLDEAAAGFQLSRLRQLLDAP